MRPGDRTSSATTPNDSDWRERRTVASAFSHALVAMAMGKSFPRFILTWPVLIAGMACSILPDLDVIGFHFGTQYGDLWGHRGLTHSLFFAGLLSAALVALWDRRRPSVNKTALFCYLFLCTASHGVLDAMTNGGLGVAFFSPFDTTRYFFPIRPVAVSPIGIDEFFTEYGLQVLANEALWIWLPTGIALVILRTLYRLTAPSAGG